MTQENTLSCKKALPKKRNKHLDFLKFLSALMVICVHAPAPEPAGFVIALIGKVSVLIFFMISGYFYSHVKEKHGETDQIKKIAKLFLISNLIYFVFSTGIAFLKDFSGYLTRILNLNTIFEFVVLNESPFSPHLWYLGAILYVLIILYFFEKKWDRKKLYLLIPFLFLIDFVFGRYSRLLFGKEFSYLYVRNFLFVGLPYFLIGDIVCRYKERIKIKNSTLWMVGFVLLTFLEDFLIKRAGLSTAREHGIGTTFLSICIFLKAACCTKDISNRIYNGCCWIGNKLCLYIYICHMMIALVYSVVMGIMPIDLVKSLLSYMRPIFVFGISVFVSWIIYKIEKRFSKKYKIT